MNSMITKLLLINANDMINAKIRLIMSYSYIAVLFIEVYS